MTPDTIAIVVSIVIAAGTVFAAILLGHQSTRRDIAGLHRDVTGIHRDIGDLRERMARLEGLLEGFTRREPARGTPEAPP